MKFTARIPVTAGLLVLLASTVGCNKLKARDQLNKGIQAFKSAQFEEAVNHFQTSIQLDPTYELGRLYLATAYASQVVPGLETPANLATAQKAIDGFQAVLAKDPSDLTALKQIASIRRNVHKFEEAKDYERRVIALDANDAEANYTIGVVDWIQAHNNVVTILGAENKIYDGLGDVGKSKDACAKIQAQNGPLVTDGMQYLKRAIELNPSYEDAMAYLNLTYRLKADLECGNDADRKADVAQANDWVKKAMNQGKINEKAKEDKEHAVQ